MVVVKNKEMFIRSECCTEALNVTYDEEDDVTMLAFWSWGRGDNITLWKWRLYHIWHIIKTGTPYNDEIILNSTGRKLLIQALQAQDKEAGITTVTTSN